MANTQQQQKQALANEIKNLQTQISYATAPDATLSAEEKATIKVRVNKLKARLSSARSQLATINKAQEVTKAADEEAVKIKNNEVVVTSAMAAKGIDADLLALAKASGLAITPESILPGNVSSGAFVYLGTKQAVTGPKGAKKFTLTTKPNLGFVNNVYKQFWSDETVKAKVKSAMVRAGITDVNDITAYAQWQKVVSASAELFASGAKITPMDVLNQTMTNSGTANLPDRTITKVDPAITNAIANAAYQSAYMRDADEQEIKDILKKAGVDKMIAEGTVTTTKKVKNPKTGKLENVTTTTPGFNAQTAQLTIEDKLKELNPDEFDRTKRIEWQSWLSKNLAGAQWQHQQRNLLKLLRTLKKHKKHMIGLLAIKSLVR